jgi:hypothetical protein
MGNTTSTDGVAAALPGAAEGAAGAARTTTQLYRWMQAVHGGSWELVSDDAGARLYDANEDRQAQQPEWHLELEGAQEAPDIKVDDSFEFQASENKCAFVADNSVWGLHFPGADAFDRFCQRYNKALFENQHGVERNEENELKVSGEITGAEGLEKGGTQKKARKKIGMSWPGGAAASAVVLLWLPQTKNSPAPPPLQIYGADLLPRLGGESDASRASWADDMDVDAPAPGERTAKRKERVAAEARGADILGVVMGAGDRSYVVRDGEIDVLKNVYGGVQDAGVKFSLGMGGGGARRPGPSRLSLPGGGAAATPPPGTPGGAAGRTPNKALLMDQETKMTMLTPGSTSMFQANIETGRVVNEFSFCKDGVAVPMRDIAADSKSAQMESHVTFLSLDANRLARWDPRAPGGLVQEMASPAALTYVGGKDYARGTKFSCMATSGDGYVVVGADDGKVRLYSEKTLSQAKTSISGLGAPVKAVDVTYDGKWVLATTRNYLMVVKTAYKDAASGREACGFTSRMGAAAPAPRLLRLRPADAARTGGAPLEKGHFTWITEAGRQERWIVASCGTFTVLWNFRAVKTAAPDVTSMGGLTTVTTYHLIAKKERVVDSVFMHDKYARTPTGAEDAMVVVTDRKVYAAADSEGEEEEGEEEEGQGPAKRLW